MKTTEAIDVIEDKSLSRYIWDEAHNRAPTTSLADEYVKEAWLCISCVTDGHPSTYYYQLAYKAIFEDYWQHNKDYLLAHTNDHHIYRPHGITQVLDELQPEMLDT